MDERYYSIRISPEVIKNDLFLHPYNAGDSEPNIDDPCCEIVTSTTTQQYTGYTYAYSSMTQVVSGGTNGNSLLTGLTVPVFLTETTIDIGYYLFLEKKNNILIKYLNKNFKQNLLLKTKEINSLLIAKYSNLEKIKNNNNNTIVSIKTITLSNIRYLIGIENKGSKNIDGNYDPNFSYNLIEAVNSNTLNSNYFLFNKIIARMREESDPSNFYLLYFPERKNLFSKKNSEMYYAVKKICEKNNVKFIDLNKELKNENIKFIKSLYPRSFEHPNEKGYKFISHIILKNVSK
jgi:lysophospholipase L1-like esterase